jgi:hypothetical protein
MTKARPDKHDATHGSDRIYASGQRDALGRALNAVQQAMSLEQARRAIKALLANVKGL